MPGPTGEGTTPPPDFVIIGAQRSRSTLLTKLLKAHPGIFMPRSEIGYFEDPFWECSSAQTLDRHFAAARRGQVTGFKRPELLGRPECPPRLAGALPQAKLVVVLREPVSRTVSAYFHYVRSRHLPIRPLNDGLRAILNGETDGWPHAWEVIEFSRYGGLLERYLEHFDRKAICIAFERDFDREPDRTLERILGHIGVAPLGPPARDRVVNHGVYSLPRLRVLRLGSRLVYPTDPVTGLVRARSGLGWRVGNRAISELDRLLLQPYFENRPPPLADDVRSRLQATFEPDVASLARLVGKPPEGWPAG